MLSRAPLFTNKKGFTLVELMVGMVVAVMVMGMTYAIFTSQLKLTKTEMSINDLQLNTQTTLRYLAKELRNAGYGVSTKITVPVVRWFDSDENNSDFKKPQDMNTSSDAIFYFRSNNPSEFGAQNYSSTSVDITRIHLGLRENELLLLYDSNGNYQIVKILNISEDDSSASNPCTHITFEPGWGQDFSHLPGGTSFSPSYASCLGDFNLLYVDNNNVLRIRRANDNFPLMRNVLSLQIMVGRDTDGDDVVDSWTYNISDLTSLYEIKAVKMFIITATSTEEKGVSMNVMDKIDQIDQNANGIWSQEVDWSAVLSNYEQVHGGQPGVPRVYSFGCELRNVYTCN